MPRQNYMTMPVSDSIQQVFDKFVTSKGITKTAALTDMLELYMIATDEELYLGLKKKTLNVEGVRGMILEKELVFEDVETLCNTFIFMKLGMSEDKYGKPLNGIDTMRAYMADEKKRGYTWFSTESLYFGMAKDKIKYFEDRINRGETVKILFAVGVNAGGVNEIAFSANVLEISSNAIPSPAPENAYPVEWGSGIKARIWIKINNIRERDTISVDNLLIKSTGEALKPVITNSQYHFGYVTLKE